MQTRPTSSSIKPSSHHNNNKRSTPRIRHYSQHGSAQSHSVLLALPPESLTHITAYLDPPALYKLALCCRRLRDHVAQDNVWHRAFVWAYLGIGPESDEDGKEGTGDLMMRRRENTWKKEYISRWNLVRRVHYSRNPTVTHVPTHSAISSHLLFPTTLSLLSASLTYGIVARSLPMTGRVLKGFLDANGTFNGLGIGNPNAEFSVEVSAIELGREGDAQEGATGRVVWGFRSGDVAVTKGVKSSEVGRAGRLVRSLQADAHTQRIETLHLGALGTFASAGGDGLVKIWDGAGRDSHSLRCIWTSTPAPSGSVVGRLCKVVYEGSFVAAALTGGQILVWHGVDVAAPLTASASSWLPKSPVIIPPPAPAPSSRVGTASVEAAQEPATLLLNIISAETAVLLVHYADADHFWRIRITFPSSSAMGREGEAEIERTRFAGGPLGAITSVTASFAPTTGPSRPNTHPTPTPLSPPSPPTAYESTIFEMSDIPAAVQQPRTLQLDLDTYASIAVHRARSFVVSGDALGRVCVWDWEAEGVQAPLKEGAWLGRRAIAEPPVVAAWRRWEAHEDGAISALKVKGGLLVTGSSQGSVKIWDPLPPHPSPSPLRVLPSPSPRPQQGAQWEGVTQISLEGDVLVASVGSRVVAWRGGNLGREKVGKSKGKGRGASRAGAAKYAQQIELNRDISDSRRALQHEQHVFQTTVRRELQQRERLDELGLDEIGAVEYALMLSRDEEERRMIEGLTTPDDEALWQGETLPAAINGVNGDEEHFDMSPSTSRGSSYSQPNMFSPSTSRRPSMSPGMSRYLSSSAHSSSSYLSSRSVGKVQVSPLLRPEPTHAGSSYHAEASTSPPTLSIGPARYGSVHSSGSVESTPSTTPAFFPSLPPSQHASAHSSPLLGPTVEEPSRPVSRSPESSRPPLTGWNSIARSAPTTPALANNSGFVSRPIKPGQTPGRTSLLSARLASLSPSDGRELRAVPNGKDEEEEMLRFVMELSLAEARSTGLDV